jgi:hypothetical protein
MFPEFEKYSLYPKSKGTITSSNTLPMEKQTAVEWLIERYHELMIDAEINDTHFSILDKRRFEIFEQAKQMEREQLQEMYLNGIQNYDPTFKRKSQWTEVDNMTKRLK